MAIFGKIIGMLTGGVGEKIIDTATKYFPPKLSEAEKKQIENAIRQETRAYELKLLEMAHKEQEEFNNRIKELEGTAQDLSKFGIFGKIIIFLRGAQRPIWGYLVLFMDVMVFSGQWELTKEVPGVTDVMDLQSAFWIINMLVLGFLFGERAVRNVMPLMQNRLGMGQGGQKAQG